MISTETALYDRLALARPEAGMRVSCRSIETQAESANESVCGSATALEIEIATAPDAPFSN